ncbi:MAG: rhodanese-like domain-containing protein [Nitrospinae bacterium]|nr:rhodanese-like domain-containing protein [Nitrospinota bacterium]
MNWYERSFFIGIVALLSFALLAEGRRTYLSRPEAGGVIEAKALYETIRAAPADYQVVDIRPLEDFKEGHVPGAVNIPEGELAPNAPIDRYKKTVIISEEGDTAASLALAREMRVAQNLSGGMSAWWKSRLPEESGVFDPSKKARGPAGCL